jgi:serine protease Do
MTSKDDQRDHGGPDSGRPARSRPGGVFAMRSAMVTRVAAPVAAALFSAGAFAFGQDTALLQDERNTIEIFRRASPGVVHVEARDAAETKFERKVVQAGTASGFFIDVEGRILTNAHVIDGKNEIDVVLGGGRRVPARLVGTAPQLDLALLQVTVPAGETHPLPLGDSAALQVGQKILVIGNPLGLHNTLTVGVVSALNRTVPGTPMELGDALIQTDAAINPGSSGGPMLNSAGEVVGVNTLGSNAQGLGFAVPIHLARRIIADLIEMGHAYRPQLGFNGTEITPAIARLFGLPVTQGLLVEEVLPRSPAAVAGLRAGGRIVVSGDKTYTLGGDIVTAVNGQPVSGASTIARALMDGRPGDLLRLEVAREGRTIEILILLDKMKMQF